LPKLVSVIVLPHHLSRPVDLHRVAVVSVLCHSNIYPVAAVTAIAVGALARVFVEGGILVGGFVVNVVIVKGVIAVVLRIITSVAIIVVLESTASIATTVELFICSILYLFLSLAGMVKLRRARLLTICVDWSGTEPKELKYSGSRTWINRKD
jgi:hypothetical protein